MKEYIVEMTESHRVRCIISAENIDDIKKGHFEFIDSLGTEDIELDCVHWIGQEIDGKVETLWEGNA